MGEGLVTFGHSIEIPKEEVAVGAQSTITIDIVIFLREPFATGLSVGIRAAMNLNVSPRRRQGESKKGKS